MKKSICFYNILCYGGIMETIASFLSSVDKKAPLSWILLILIVLVLFNQTKMKQDISFIKTDLNNHITETNKKIDKHSDRLFETNKKIDKQREHFDTRFDRLYELLLQDKQNKSK